MSVDTDLEKLRLRIGDTDVGDSGNNARFKDSELNYFLSAESNDIASAALLAVESWVAKTAASYDFETDGQSFSRSQQAKAFLELAKHWRKLGITTSLDSDVGGISSVASTKIDGYSTDVSSTDVSYGGTANARQRYYRAGELDRYP